MHLCAIDEAGDRPVVLRPGFQSKKRLFTILFNHTGPLVVGILPEKSTTCTTFQKWLRRLQLWVDSHGEYFETP